MNAQFWKGFAQGGMLALFGCSVVLAMSYGLALAGEPRAYWLMHDMVGWM